MNINYSENSRKTLLENTKGKINTVLFFFPSWILYPEIRLNEKNEIKEYLNIYKKIFSSFSKDVKLIIVTHRIAKIKITDLIINLNLKNKFKIIYIDNLLDFSIWSQDSFLIGQNELYDFKYFIKPSHFIRKDDDKLVEIIAAKTKTKLLKTDLFFQGGNILVGDDFLFIGGNDLITNKLTKSIDNNKISEFCSSLDNKKKIIPIFSKKKIPTEILRKIKIGNEVWEESIYYGNLNNTVQPIFHIDMFITIVGKNKNGQNTILVGDTKLEKFGFKQKKTPNLLTNVFDQIAHQLSNQNFEIIRIPLPMISYDDKFNKIRKWYYATYNNVIVENNPKCVWIPNYNVKEFDYLHEINDYNVQVWKKLGYKVNIIRNFNKFTQNYGSINCIAKVLNRI